MRAATLLFGAAACRLLLRTEVEQDRHIERQPTREPRLLP